MCVGVCGGREDDKQKNCILFKLVKDYPTKEEKILFQKCYSNKFVSKTIKNCWLKLRSNYRKTIN
jgi:hypothetical protein